MEKAKTNQNAFSAMGKWFYAFIATAVLLVGAIVAIVIIALGANGADEPPAIGEGDETGIYYYDAALGEYLLMLNSGNQFTIAGPDINKSGTYSVAENTLTLDFVRDEDGTAQATLNGSSLSLVYKDATMNFLKKIPYSVSFNAMGGSAVESVTVINGKTVIKPNDPTKEGSVFLGWYADEAYTKAFFFGTTPVFENTTVYAKWAETVPGKDEFVVDFDLGFEGGAMDAISTVGGKLVFNAEYEAPTREGYTFVGWFVSAYEDGSKLTYQATENTELSANTTLFAVWADDAATKLQTPAVSVVGNTLSWVAVEGATSYTVVITDAEGNVILNNPSVGSTTFTYDFAGAAPGDYTISVVAKGSAAEDSDAAIRYYQNKGLGRVYKFEVVGDTLVFNAVENAEKYLITIDCGNDQHNHTLFDNGKSTYFNFANCPMQAGGIAFTVTAVADGYASTTSETFYFVRNLDKVTGISYDAATSTFKWTSVANATKYYVSITCGTHTHALVDNGATTSYSVKGCSGEISITVIPASNGYNSPEGATATITKTTPATPTNITINGMTVSWDAVEGAKSYIVKVNGTSYNVNGTSYNLQDTGITFTTGSKHTVSVTTIGETDSSVASDTIEMSYLTMGKISYNQNTVSWAPVLGVTKFDVRVNGGEIFSVNDATSAKVVLTKAGVNKIEVRPAGFATGVEWTSVEVFAYEVIYETRSLNGSVKEYVAKGDTMMLPTNFTYAGFDFDGWYNTPGAAEGNGSEYTDSVFVGNGNMTLYANWAPKSYTITFVGITDVMSGAQNDGTATATYTKNYTLPVLTTTDLVKSNFAGWYTGPDGTGTKLTDYQGNSVAPYGVTGDSYAYPYFTSGLIFELKSDNTYSVKKGTDINTIPEVTIPATYNGLPVTTILENAFYNCDSLITINIPDTILLIGTGAFSSCDGLVAFNVYEVETETPHEVFYSSYEGALIYEDTASGYTYLEAFPRAKKGAFTIPETVEVVRNRAFNYANISSLTIAKEVLIIGDYAFSNCRSLKTIVFEEGGTTPVSVSTNAFYGCYAATSIKLPALIKGSGEKDAFNVTTLDYLTALQTIEVEKVVGAYFSAVEGMLCDSLGTTILYCPKAYTGISGVLTIPKGITAIGEGTFANRNVFTEIIIPNYVTEIGASAFAGCRNVTKITIEGLRSRDLTIGANAFYACSKVRSVVFEGSGNTTVDAGKTTIGASAFGGMTELRTLTVEAGANIAEIGASAFASNLKLRSIDIADTAVVTVIGNSAFKGCEVLSSFTIPASTTTIGDSAFADCSFISKIVFAPNGQDIAFGSYVFQNCVGLARVELPATVKSFNGSAFDGCYSLQEIVVDPANTFLTTKNGVLYNKDFTEIMFYPKGINDPDLSELPWNTLTTIGATVFKDNTNITSVTIPANVTVIGDSAFNGCINMTSVTIANGTDLKIGNYAFANCQKLTAITLPSSTTKIGNGAFYVTPLTAITIPEKVTSIGAYAFMYSNLETVTIPSSVTLVGDGAFAYTKLTSVTIEGGDNALVLGDKTEFNINYGIEAVSPSSADRSYVFPIHYIGVNAHGVFTGTNLTELNLPARVTTLGAFSFYNMTSLKTVTIAENSNLTTIGIGAFYGSGLTSINLENSKVATIEDYAFAATKLTSVKFPNTLELLDKYCFTDIGNISGTKFTGTLTNVEFATGGTAKLTIKEQAFRNSAFTTITFPKNLFHVSDNIMVISNDPTYGVVMPSFYRIFEGNYKLAAINVEEGCEMYGSDDGVFYAKGEGGVLDHLLMCPPSKTGTYTVPKTVTKVAHRAFYLSQLTTVNFEEYDVNDPNYRKALLTIGTASTTNTNTQYAVFGGQITSASSSTRTALSMYHTSGSEYVKTNVLNSHYLSSSKIAEINFPSHIGTLSSYSIMNIGTTNFKINFNQDSAQAKFCAQAIYSNKGLVSLVLPKVQSLSDRGDWVDNTFAYNSALKEIKFAPGSTVTLLPYSAFNGCSSLTTIEIPKSVTAIEEQCFYNCKKLTSITYEDNECNITFIAAKAFSNTGFTEFVIPDSVEVAEYSLFQGCLNLKKVTIGTGLKSVAAKDANGIASSIFYDTYGPTSQYGSKIEEYAVAPNHPTMVAVDGVLYDLTKSILYAFPDGKSVEGFTIPDTVRTIFDFAFQWYSGTSVTLPEGLTNIGYGAFYQSKLASVYIPASVVEIGGRAFYMASDGYMKTVTFGENSQLKTIGSNAFTKNNFSEIDIPDGVTAIGSGAFSNNTKLQKVFLPAALTRLENSTFAGCTAMTEVTLQNSIEYIGVQCFNNCDKLKSVVIPASVTKMDNQVFYNSDGIEEVIFAEGSRLSSMGNYMFYNATKLKTVTLPEGVSEVKYGMFNGCKSLEYVDASKTSFTNMTVYDPTSSTPWKGFFTGCTSLKVCLLPETLETIEEKWMQGLTSLESIHIPSSVTTIANYAFDGCTSLASVTFGEDSALTALGSSATIESAIFRNTTALTSIKLPDSIEIIGANIFENSGLTTVSFPDSLTGISVAAFKGCEGLTKVNIPGSVMDIHEEAFMNCVNIETLTMAEGVEYLGANAFGNCGKISEILVPATTMRMGGNPFANCTGLTSFGLAQGNEGFVIDQTGVLYDVNMRTVIFYPSYVTSETYQMPSTVFELASSAFAGSQLKSVVISDNIKIVPTACFKGSAKLESVTIPLSVLSIEAEAFMDCVKLDNVAIPASCTFVGNSAFENCASLTAFDFGTRNTEMNVGTAVFRNCVSFENVVLPDGLTAIPDYMFENTGVKNLVIPESVTNMEGTGLFMNCTKLETIEFPETLTGRLGAKAFYGCTSLKSVVLPEGIKSLGDNKWDTDDATFMNCTSLESVVFGSAMSSVGTYGFANCTSLKSVDFSECSMWEMSQYAFKNCTGLEYVNLGYAYDVYEMAFEGCTGLKTVEGLGYCWLYGGLFKGCTGIEELHIEGWVDEFDNYDPELGDCIDAGNFNGWTAEQTIYFDYATWEELFDSCYGFIDEDEWCFPFEGCAARVFDCEGNEMFYDAENFIMTKVVSPDGEVLWEYE